MKYIPKDLARFFNLNYHDRVWRLEGETLLRPTKLYTPKNYHSIMETLREKFPQYLYYCPFRGKTLVSVPKDSVRRLYIPCIQLRKLIELESRDPIQDEAINFIETLSGESGVPIEKFGLHGSISLGTYSSQSDIDVVVYGSKNFRKIEETLLKLEKEGVIQMVYTKKYDFRKRQRGRYRGRLFFINAVKEKSEIKERYGEKSYHPIKPVNLKCLITDDDEAMFRPSIYKVRCIEEEKSESELDFLKLNQVVSMIGYYRNIARRGDIVSVSGMLEKVESNIDGTVSYQVVIGSGTGRNEHIWPMKTSV